MRPMYSDNAWLAVRCANPDALLAALSLSEPVAMTWAERFPQKQWLREQLRWEETRRG